MNMRYMSLETAYIVAESSAELYPAAIWKAEFRSDKMVHLAEEVSKKSVEHITFFLLAA